ncbi:hypothetical protein OIU76_029801 [Salix suchowensis]|nr:hypothetical protein OIU76_029801 [Salix suchowensis]
MEKMNQAFEKVKMLVRMEVEDEEQGAATVESSSFTFMDDFNRDCTLSTKQRFYGFAICFSAGLACVLLSMLVFFNPVKFGITFTFGNLLSLGRSVFWSYVFYAPCCCGLMKTFYVVIYASISFLFYSSFLLHSGLLACDLGILCVQ